jgi:hypothetical protein
MLLSSIILFDVTNLQEIYFSIIIKMEIIFMWNVNRQIMIISVSWISVLVL